MALQGMARWVMDAYWEDEALDSEALHPSVMARFLPI